LVADSRVRIGAVDDDALVVGGSRLLNSIGEETPTAFTISPVGGDVAGTPTTDPSSKLALFSDEIFVGSGGQTSSRADFTISGLDSVPVVDLYFYSAEGRIVIAGAEEEPIATSGDFNQTNTRFFKGVPISAGIIRGSLEGDPGRLAGLTLVRPPPHPVIKTVSPSGRSGTPSSIITIQIEDYISEIAPETIQLWLNGQNISPAVTKPVGSKVTTIRFDPRGSLPEGANGVRVIFGDKASPATLQTYEYRFIVVGGTQLPVTPEMLAGPLNFFASPSGLKFAEPVPYGIANNVSDHGWIWPNDNTGSLVIDFGIPTALAKVRVYSTYAGSQRGAIWAVEHSSDQIKWINSTNFLFETTAGGGVNDDGSPRTDYAGWYEAHFNTTGQTFQYWRVLQTAVTAGHAPRAAQVQFYQLSAPATPLEVLIQAEPGKLTIAWADPFDTAVLQSANEIAGLWEDVPNAFSPHDVTPSATRRFYRLRTVSVPALRPASDNARGPRVRVDPVSRRR
jgi:hypothetical protein